MKKLLSPLFICLILGPCICIALAAYKSSSPDSYGVGTRLYASENIADTVNASTVLKNSHLSVPIAKNQHLHVRYSLPFSLAAVDPGIKFQVTAPSGVTAYNVCTLIYSDADSLVAVSNIVAQAAVGFTLATIGNHYATVEADIVNGSTAGNVVLQFAQNVSNASNTILMRGGYGDVITW